MPFDFSSAVTDFAYAFLSIMLEGVPFILLGTLASGAIAAFLPGTLLARWLPKNPIAAVMLSGLMGALFPLCECGVVPVIRRLLKKGLPLACGLTYMLSAPIVNLVVVISTYAAFTGQQPGLMTSMRLLVGYIAAVIAGLVVLKLPERWVLRPGVIEKPKPFKRTGLTIAGQVEPTSSGIEVEQTLTFRQKLGLAVNTTVIDFLQVAFYLAIGAALTALFKVFVDQSAITPLAFNEPAAIATMMILAMILSLCSTSDAFIAATFVIFPMASKLAFLTFGPMFDLKLIFLYRVVFRGRFILWLGIGLFFLIGLVTWRLDIVFNMALPGLE